MSQHSITKTWIVLIIILVAIFSSGWFIFDKYFQYELEKTSEESKKELDFLSDLIKQRLQKHDYQLVEDFIIDWGKRDSSIVEIILTSTNGFELASYSSSLTPTHELIEEAQLTYSYDGLADLYLRKSLDDAYAIHRSFLYELLAGYIFIAFIFYYLTYTLVHTKKQKQELIFENTQRVQAEEKIRTLYQAIEQSPVSVMITD
ncbi:MAG: hypothetical protein KAU21_14995, partial [Gammaproteobacteria bacterium]|nr:hypothetical protein [Gammaproteobacteria bacterium]